jgi:hypothetical protein
MQIYIEELTTNIFEQMLDKFKHPELLQGRILQELRKRAEQEARELLVINMPKKDKEYSEEWKCPNPDCNYTTFWSYRELADQGGPVCPECGYDLVRKG